MTAEIAVPSDILRQVRRLELRTKRLVDSRFAGDYRSLFKGQGMEFAEVREYQPGDEVRTIDWNVSARMGKPFVKRYVEERELTVMLALDVSASSLFGSTARFKRDMASEMLALLALCAVRNNDRVGLFCFSDRIEHALPPRKGRRHALRLLRDLISVNASGRKTLFTDPLERMGRLLPNRSVVFVCSDFVAPDIERPLSQLAQRHEVIALSLEDPTESILPNIGLARFVDPESGDLLEIDTSDPAIQQWYASEVSKRSRLRESLLTRLGIDEIQARTDSGYVEPLLKYFRARASRATGVIRTACLTAFSLLSFSFSGINAQAQSSSLSGNVQAGVIVDPDTVTVGDPFTITVRLRVPISSRVEWPDVSDTSAVISIRQPVVFRDGVQNDGFKEYYAQYDVAAWDTGSLVTAWPPVKVIASNDTLSWDAGKIGVYVKSVLSVDTSEHIPRPAKSVFDQEIPWWKIWWPALLILLVILAAYLFRKRSGHIQVQSPALPLNGYERAMHAFDRLEMMALSEAEEHGRIAVLSLDILRSYMSESLTSASKAQTSSELVSSLDTDERVDKEQLIDLLVAVDSAKYAGRRISFSESVEIVGMARHLVTSINASMYRIDDEKNLVSMNSNSSQIVIAGG